MSIRSSRVRHSLSIAVIVLTGTALLAMNRPAVAQSPPVELPASYQMAATAKPLSLALSAPAVLPIFVDVGLGVSSAQLNNQPFAMADAAPFSIPLLGALDLLGGPEGLVRDFLPEILIGIPSLWGGDPLPIDAATILPPEVKTYLNELLAIGIPKLRSASCTAFWPQEPRSVTCGNPVSILDAIRFKEFGGKAANSSIAGNAKAVGSRAESTIKEITTADAGGILPGLKVGEISSYAFGQPEGSLLAAGAGVKVEDVDILGLIKIDSVETSMSASMSGQEGSGKTELKPCQVKGLTLLGMPAKVTDHGLEFEDSGLVGGIARRVFGEDRNGQDFAEKVQAALAKAGVSLEVRGTRSAKSGDNGTAEAMSGACVSIGVDIPVSSTQIKINIGDVGLKMSASGADDLALNFGSQVVAPPPPVPTSPTSPTSAPSPVLATPMSSKDFVAGPVSPPELSIGAPVAGLPTAPTPPVSNQVALSARPISSECGVKCVFPPFALLALATPFLVVVRRMPGRRRFEL